MKIESPSRRHFLQASGALVIALSLHPEIAGAGLRPVSKHPSRGRAGRRSSRATRCWPRPKWC